MSHYLPKTIVTLLDRNGLPAGYVEVECYLLKEKSYKAWWTYPQSNERELIKVPEWRLVKKRI